MPAIAHAYRRGATYSWRRRIPLTLAPFCRATQLVVSLRTRDPSRARFLAGQLTAQSDRLFRDAMSREPDIILTRGQLDGIFRQALLEHLDKLDRVAAAERSAPDFDPERSRRDDRRMGWVLRLLAARGGAAQLDAATMDQLRDDGLDEVDIAEVGIALGRLIRQNGHQMPRERLQTLLEQQEAPATGVNLALAQETVFRAMSAAAFATERRWDGIRPEDSRKLDLMVAAELEAFAGGRLKRPEHRPSQDEKPAASEVPPLRETASSGPELAPAPPTRRPPALIPLDEHPIIVFGERLIADRGRDGNWDTKTQHQARQIFRLFAKLLHEQGLVELGELRQTHLADLVGLLRSVSPSYGKSPKDETRTTAQLRAVGASLPAAERGISGPTLNRHLTFLGQLLTFLKAQGLPISADLDVTSLRVRTRQRARTKRAALTTDDAEAIFRLPCFTGCRSWPEPFEPGPEIYHRALYYAIILLYYTGARREEICGLQIDDVGTKEGIPFIDIRPNGTRRLKNDQSSRFAALHPEVIRLGFLDYVDAVRKLGYQDVFPDLRSPGSKAPLGDRLYDEFIEGLNTAIPDASARKKVLHSFRHAFGNELKQRGVHAEVRADMLGHGGKGETDERYCDPIALRAMLEQLEKLPRVTVHLAPARLQLLPWVANRERPPFARQKRSHKAPPPSASRVGGKRTMKVPRALS